MDEELKQALRAVLQEELEPIRQELDESRQEIKALRQEFDESRQEIKEFRQEFDESRQEVKEFRQEFDESRQEVKEFRQEFDELGQEVLTDLKILKGGQKGIRAEITDRFSEVKTELNGLRSDVEFTYHKTAQNELDLRRLKRQ